MRAVNPFSPSPVHCALAIASDFCSLAAVAKWCHAQNVRSTPLLPFRFLFHPSSLPLFVPAPPCPWYAFPGFPLLHIEPTPQRGGVAGLGSGALMVVSFHSFICVYHQHTHTYTHAYTRSTFLFFSFLLLVAFIFAVFSANKVLQTASLRHDTHSSARLYGQIASLVPFWRACKTCEPLFFDEPREKKKEKNGKWALCSFGRRKKKNERMR